MKNQNPVKKRKRTTTKVTEKNQKTTPIKAKPGKKSEKQFDTLDPENETEIETTNKHNENTNKKNRSNEVRDLDIENETELDEDDNIPEIIDEDEENLDINNESEEDEIK